MASSEKPRICFFVSCRNFVRKNRASSGMSSLRSRSGGMAMGRTFSR